MEAAALGILIGLLAGSVPGPFFTMVATTALERGRRAGMLAALIPLGTELPVLLVAVLVLTSIPEEALRWVGMAGGGVLLFMAWKVVRDSGKMDREEKDEESDRNQLLRVGAVGVLSPDPWVFWLVIGGPLLINRWQSGPVHGIAFVAAFLLTLVAVRSAVAWGAASGRDLLDPTWHRRVLRGAGVVVAALGVLLVWQSWEGNFTQLIQASDRIEDLVP